MKRRRAHIFAKEKYGHYVEPLWVSRRLFEVESFRSVIYDPACGWGHILRSAHAAGYTVIGGDIVDRKRHRLGPLFRKANFLTMKGWGYADIVCNPPFDHVQEFCEHAIKLRARKVAMICLVRRLNAAHWLQQLPLCRIWLLTPRPSMPPGKWIAAGNKPGGGTQDFCWLVFEQDYAGGTPAICWLHREVSDGRGVQSVVLASSKMRAMG